MGKSPVSVHRARGMAVLGTASDVGKSLVVAGLCRLLHRAGVRVAPFKAQNMSLNSYVTADGGEMGRAQVLQAKACGLTPHVDMNPILLKPESDRVAQIIVQGKVLKKCEARDYLVKETGVLFPIVRDSYRRLARAYDVLIIEGAGSAAEVNLRNYDLVNWPVVALAEASVILVADIDRGGVFAQVIGTLDLLLPAERRRVVGVIINKFRGDSELFREGVAFIETKTRVPVLGVLPFLRDLRLDQEDSLDLERHRRASFTAHQANVAVILLPRMSNFTDFNALAAEEDVAVRYVESPADLTGADVVIVPGTKNTIADLEYLRRAGFAEAILTHAGRGGEIVGICGGYQMLGRQVCDPDGVERGGTAHGLGLLDGVTVLGSDKLTSQVEARPLFPGIEAGNLVVGYHIHVGRTNRGADLPCFATISRTGDGNGGFDPEERMDGARRANGLVWGTYIHGVFDRPGFRRWWLNRIRQRKDLPPVDRTVSLVVTNRLEQELDRWADHVAAHVNLAPILAASGVERPVGR